MNHDPQHAEEPSNEELRRVGRRGAIALLGTAGAAALVGAASLTDPAVGAPRRPTRTTTTTSGGPSSTTTGATATTTSGAAGNCTIIPQETAGPYPLDLSGTDTFYRSNITEGHPGVPLQLVLSLVNANNGCLPLANARVDVWQCDALGVYSGYSQPGANTVGQTFCRGIQLSDSSGVVRFSTIYPGWYAGRITHIHFEVFLNSGLVATSQLAFPPDVTQAVYAQASPYSSRGQNTSVTSFAADNVFSDGTQYQLLALSGSVSAGYTGTLTAAIAA